MPERGKGTLSVAIALAALGCGGGAGREHGAAGNGADAFGNSGVTMTTTATEPHAPNSEAFWAQDPPPVMCLEDGSMAPPPMPPGGTPECPDDKNREGCPCAHVGEIADCWPGLRAHRNHGICHDGNTECLSSGDVGGVWGPCEGYTLPLEGALTGADACSCFSHGTWKIDNLIPCFISFTSGGAKQVWAVSTYVDASGASACPTDPGGPPLQPQPASVWSTSRLTIDCAGHFEICYTLKAGAWANPQPSDCALTSQCLDTWYETAGQAQELPPLAAWSASDAGCAAAFESRGGYGEMTVKGLSLQCDEVDDGQGGELVFHRVAYCPSRCSTTPGAPECRGCTLGGSGDF